MTYKVTELAAVNDMLSATGDAPVNTLIGSLPAQVAIARSILNMESNKLQVKGWHFNTDKDYELAPDVDGIISIPDNLAKVDLPVHKYGGVYDPTIRQGKLWDRKNRTFVWNETIEAEVTWLFDFTDLPEVFKHYIMIRATRIFIDRTLGSENVVIFTRDDEERAWAACREYEMDQADYNIFDNIDVAPTLLR